MIFVKHAWANYVTNWFQDFNRNCIEIARFMLQRTNYFFSGKIMNLSEEKSIRLADVSHVIGMIANISPNWCSDIFLYVNKVVIINILAKSSESSWTTLSWIISFTVFSTFKIFCVGGVDETLSPHHVTDEATSLFYIVSCSIEFIMLFWLSNLASDKISEMSIKILRNFIFTVKFKIMLSFFNIWYYFSVIHESFKFLFSNV